MMSRGGHATTENMHAPLAEPPKEPLVGAFVERAGHGLGEITQAQLDDGWRRLKQTRAAGAQTPPVPQARRLRVLPWLVGSAAAGLVVALAMLGYRAPSPQPLRHTVKGLAARQGDAIEATPHAVSRLLFSDGSRIALDASTRLTVEGLDARGARIALLDGSVDVVVEPHTNASWHFAAGPFLVQVKGTAFHLAFAPTLGRLRLQMRAGQGPGAPPRHASLRRDLRVARHLLVGHTQHARVRCRQASDRFTHALPTRHPPTAAEPARCGEARPRAAPMEPLT